jgi:hypothetical protein
MKLLFFLHHHKYKIFLCSLLIFIITISYLNYDSPAKIASPHQSITFTAKTGKDIELLNNQKAKKLLVSSESINPQSASQLLENSIYTYKNITDRAKYCRDIIKALCVNGYSEEAWSLIDQSAGQVRSFQLGAYFTYAVLSDTQALDKMKLLPYRSDVSTALFNYFERIGSAKSCDMLQGEGHRKAIDELEKFSRSQLKSHTLSAIFAGELYGANKDKQSILLDRAMKLRKEGILSHTAISEVIDAANAFNPFEKWSYLSSSLKETNGGRDSMTIREKLVKSMIYADSNKAMQQLSMRHDEQGMVDFSKGLREWISIDSTAAANWFKNNSSSFTTAQKTGASLAFFKAALDYQELESAKLWAESVEDAKLRETALKVVNARLKSQPN